VFVGALALIGVGLGMLGARSGSRGTLRIYLAELQAKGEKLTYEELMRGRVTNAFDSHAIITNVSSRLRGGKVTPGMLEPRRYIGPGQAIVNWKQPSPLWARSSGPPIQGTWEELETQMQGMQDALQEAREALKAPAPDGGPGTNILTGRRINFVAIRIVAQWLMGAVEDDLHQGRLEAALQDLEALAGLANMERDEPSLVAQMIRVAVAGLGWPLTWEALQAPGWSDPQLERLQKAWQPVDLVDGVEKGFEGTRAGTYELFVMMRHSDSAQMGRRLRGIMSPAPSSSPIRFEDLMSDYLFIPAYKLTSIDQDELFYLRNMQEGITGLRLLKAHRPWAETRQRLNQITTNVNALGRSPQRLRYYFSMIAIPNYMKACETAVHGETERQMTLAAIALKRFQMRHGQFPPSLEALVPEFLHTAPYDYMGAQPLRYHLKADGSYLLYSVGEDGKDDGGDPSGGPNGMWTGRDAVWPSPAAESGESKHAAQTPRPSSSYQ
jgi:hypothetical protein